MSNSFQQANLIITTVVITVLVSLSPAVYSGDWMDDLAAEKKEEFVKKFERFKKEGLTAEEVEQLTDKLLDVAGDKIEGTGTSTMLKTMNKQAKNTVWIMNKKESAEELIDFVGDVYAMGSSDAPADPVEAYKALGKGVGLAAKLAEKMPTMKVSAVPMLEAYSQAIKNGEGHVEAIARAREMTDEFIKNRGRSKKYVMWLEENDFLAATALEEVENYEPTEEEIQWEKERKIRQEEYSKYLKQCGNEYNAYSDVATQRARLREQIEDQKDPIKEARNTTNTKRLEFNDDLKRYREYRSRFLNKVQNADEERERMQRAREGDNEEGYLAHKDMLDKIEKELGQWKEKLYEDYDQLSRKRDQYNDTKLELDHRLSEKNDLVASYKSLDSVYKKSKADFDNCIKLAEAGLNSQPENEGISGVWESSWGSGSTEITFKQMGETVEGSYPSHRNGRIYGTLNGNVMNGYWVQDTSDRECNTLYRGSKYWGNIQIVFSDNTFDGNWSFCGSGESGGSWDGTKRSD